MEQDDFDPILVRHGSTSRPARRRSTFRSPRSRLYKTPRNTSSGAEVTNPSPGTARLPRPRAMRVRFDWDYDGIACRGADLEKPIPGSDPAMARYLTEHFDSILSPPRSEVSETVRELMWVLVKSGNCSAERVAKLLGADRRTINRRLATEGQSYSSILDAVRRDIGLTPVKYPS
jgi:hypothetical protein